MININASPVSWFANNIGISREGIHKKIGRESEFKASEIIKIKELLSLSDYEVKEYFLLSAVTNIHDIILRL